MNDAEQIGPPARRGTTCCCRPTTARRRRRAPDPARRASETPGSGICPVELERRFAPVKVDPALGVAVTVCSCCDRTHADFAPVAWWLSVLRWEDGIARWVQPPPHVRNDRRRADGDDHDAQRATRRRAGATAGLPRTWPARAPAAAGNGGGTSADHTPRGQSASDRPQGRCTLPLPHRVARLARCLRAAARVGERGFCDDRKPEIGDEVSGLRA
jgi:hypothetical protein